MNINVKLFGPQAQLVGQDELVLELTNAQTTCADLRDHLTEQAPALAPSLPASRFAVNHEYADDDQPVTQADEVALIGMVSGG